MTFLAQGTGEGTVKGRERMGIKEAQGREGKGVERGGEEGKARRNGELTLTHEP